jgi:predicted small integral membrane protein
VTSAQEEGQGYRIPVSLEEDARKKKRRKGFLPFENNLFDRIFLGAVLYFAVHLLWMRFLEQFITIRVANVLMICVAVVIIMWGGDRE